MDVVECMKTAGQAASRVMEWWIRPLSGSAGSNQAAATSDDASCETFFSVKGLQWVMSKVQEPVYTVKMLKPSVDIIRRIIKHI